jgi:hypothetical protein
MRFCSLQSGRPTPEPIYGFVLRPCCSLANPSKTVTTLSSSGGEKFSGIPASLLKSL